MTDSVTDKTSAALAKRNEIAKRALAEAAKRRAEIDARAKAGQAEKGGRGGLDPARYGDWEIKGLTSDF